MLSDQVTEQFRDIPLLPLRGVLVFPYMVIHLDVGGKNQSMLSKKL